MDKNNYFIKSGYQIQNQSFTLDKVSNSTYWTPYRLDIAKRFQFYVYEHAAHLLRQFQYDSVLDIGSGPPIKLKSLIAPYCENITLIDQESIGSVVEGILPSANFISANLEIIDIDLDKKFPLIICADVIEHLLDPNPCLEFIHEHLSDDGFAIISTPERDFLRGEDCIASPKKEHVREWNREELAMYIQSHHFDIIAHDFFPQEKQNALTFTLSRTIPMSIWSHFPALSKKWGGCQMIVCKLRH